MMQSKEEGGQPDSNDDVIPHQQLSSGRGERIRAAKTVAGEQTLRIAISESLRVVHTIATMSAAVRWRRQQLTKARRYRASAHDLRVWTYITTKSAVKKITTTKKIRSE